MARARVYAPYLAMIMVQLSYGCANILIKVALDKGQNQLVFVVYRHLVGMVILGPLAYALERKQQPTMSLMMIVKIFIVASMTTVNLNVCYAGLQYTTATVSSALNNVIPAFTFLLAVLLRMEKVNLRSVRGRAKVVGTVICIGGALIFTFWKGGYLFKSLTEKPLVNIHGGNHSNLHHKEDWVKGAGLILISQFAWCIWLFLQAAISEIYPAKLSLNTWLCFFVSLQSSGVALIFDRKLSSWKLGWNVQLVSILVSGILSTALACYIQTWVIMEKGPVFSAMFSPLLVLIVGIFSAIAFAEQLHLSSLIGAVLIIVGLYCVLWGRSKDSPPMKKESIAKSDDKSSHHQALDINMTRPVIVPTSDKK